MLGLPKKTRSVFWDLSLLIHHVRKIILVPAIHHNSLTECVVISISFSILSFFSPMRILTHAIVDGTQISFSFASRSLAVTHLHNSRAIIFGLEKCYSECELRKMGSGDNLKLVTQLDYILQSGTINSGSV